MISFYPGPSQLYPQIREFMNAAVDTGILSVNHRSDTFVQMAEATMNSLRKKLLIPDDYQIYFASSATECWEIIAQSLSGFTGSIHLFNGAFGQKWYEYSGKLGSICAAQIFDPEEEPPFPQNTDGKLLCITHNETSNATQLSRGYMKQLRALYPDSLIAVDATSSMAGASLDFKQADIWFASVQKCFGLPAGLAVMICSPQAVTKSKAIGESRHYNSLTFMDSMMQKKQTTYTPNVLAIFLLGKIMDMVPVIDETAELLRIRKNKLLDFFNNQTEFKSLISNKKVQSDTVLCLSAGKKQLRELKERALTEGMVLGNGYGAWADNSFRIANFPAIEDEAYDRLIQFIKAFS